MACIAGYYDPTDRRPALRAGVAADAPVFPPVVLLERQDPRADADELYPELDMATVPRVGGIPRFACREGVSQFFRYLRTRRGDPLVAFIEELKLLQYLGLFVHCWRRRRMAGVLTTTMTAVSR